MFKYGVLLTLGTFVCVTAECTLEYDPVCGSDGRTYINNCAFEIKAKNDLNVTKAFKGECSKAVNTTQDLLGDWMEESSSEEYDFDKENAENVTIAVDDEENISINVTTVANNTEHIQISIEGNDDLRFQKILDDLQKAIDVFNALSAELDKKNSPKETEEGKVRRVRAVRSCPCPKNLFKVCGTDGVTYSNPCLLNCAAKNREIKMLHEGACDKKNRKPRAVTQGESIVKEGQEDVESTKDDTQDQVDAKKPQIPKNVNFEFVTEKNERNETSGTDYGKEGVIVEFLTEEPAPSKQEENNTNVKVDEKQRKEKPKQIKEKKSRKSQNDASTESVSQEEDNKSVEKVRKTRSLENKKGVQAKQNQAKNGKRVNILGSDRLPNMRKQERQKRDVNQKYNRKGNKHSGRRQCKGKACSQAIP